MRPSLGLFVLAIALAGCKQVTAPPLKNPGPAALPSGWVSVGDVSSGVSLDVPGGWRQGVARTFDPSSIMGGEGGEALGGPAQEMGASLVKEDAAMEKAQLDRMREKEGIVLHCTNDSRPIPGEEPTRIYVRKLPDAGFGSLADAALAEKREGHREMKTEEVELPVGKAVRLEAKGKNRIGDEECHVSYVLLDGKDAYVLRLAATNASDTILSVERQVAQTFRLAKR